ncbi:hypothetical protein RF55_26294, partial [Lasius niger]
MDSNAQMLRNVREVLGCNNIRSLEDLAPMRQTTLERRLSAAQDSLSPASIDSIYATWLQEQAFRAADVPPSQVIERWCHYLAYGGCSKKSLTIIWMQAALTVLDKWFSAMSPERVRQVRSAICDEISAKYPGHDLESAVDVDAMSRIRTSA